MNVTLSAQNDYLISLSDATEPFRIPRAGLALTPGIGIGFSGARWSRVNGEKENKSPIEGRN